jgi:hypothetical protein
LNLTKKELDYIAEKLADNISNRQIARDLWGESNQEYKVRRAINNGLVGVNDNQGDKSLNEAIDLEVFNPKVNVYSIETSKTVVPNVTHLMIPDTQCKPDISLDYLKWLGEYIAEKQPEVIIHIGDHADMESLSSYDKGKGKAEGKRVQKDIDAAIEGMNVLLKPLYDLQQQQRKEVGEVLYKPKMVMTIGNHEERIMRHVNDNPELQGFLDYDNLKYKDFGWEVYDFLKPVIVNGVSYCHYMANPMTGRPYGGMAMNVLKNVGESFCMGHKQCLDVATRFLPASGKQQWAIIAGAYYEHNEDYKGHQGNHHWRGVVMQHNVKNGSFNPMFVDLEYLKDRYGAQRL